MSITNGIVSTYDKRCDFNLILWCIHFATIRFAGECSNVYDFNDFVNRNKIVTSKLLNRGSYMSARVLLNLLNELGKRDKMRGLPSILSLFRDEFNKFNNTRAQKLDSIYHMTNT